MEALPIYLLKSSLCAIIFLAIYWCFFKNETFYRFNRYFLLTGLIGSVLLPFYTYSYVVHVIPDGGFSQFVQTTKLAGDTRHGWFNIALAAYSTGACILLIRHVIGLTNVKRIINQYGCISAKGYKLVKTPFFKSSFSVFNYIILNASAEVSHLERKMILEHELAHIKQGHWIDLLVAQVFCIVQWFNPFAWLYLYAIKQNHEYLADHTVLQLGNSPAMYRAALINHSLGTSAFTFASSFSHFDKLKRINMMKKPASASAKKMAVVVVLPALAFFFWTFAKPKVIYPKTYYPYGRTASATIGSVKAIVKKPLSLMKPNDSPPLIFLDGIQVKSTDVIDPKDIESIDVLKDKAAIAVYGEKGKNGVIRISSKKTH